MTQVTTTWWKREQTERVSALLAYITIAKHVIKQVLAVEDLEVLSPRNLTSHRSGVGPQPNTKPQ
eukprot:4373046-Lingulodinium_polyedra.AAC.1